MPSKKEIIDRVLDLIEARYHNGTLRSQSDVAAGALAVLELFSRIEDDESGDSEENEEKNTLFDQVMRSTTEFSFRGIKTIHRNDIPLEIRSPQVDKEIENLRNDPNSAHAREYIADVLAEGFKRFNDYDNTDLGLSVEEVNVLCKRFKKLSRRYKEIYRWHNDARVAAQELETENEYLLNYCEEILPKVKNIRELQEFRNFLMEGIEVHRKIKPES